MRIERSKYRETIKRCQRAKLRRSKEFVDSLKKAGCSICGYKRCLAALDFHHPDPTQKERSMRQVVLNYSRRKIKQEAEKRILVCANCHREIHAGMITPPPKRRTKDQEELPLI